MHEHELGVFDGARPRATAPELALGVGGRVAGDPGSAEAAEMVYELATVRLRRSNRPQQSRT